MDMEKLKKLNEPHLSGANIPSLVKQLSSSKPKDVTSSEPSKLVVEDGIPLRAQAKDKESTAEPSPQPQPPKKQVRRRLHTSRPYQERLLNMAEARREIVTALKFHRAAMKKAKEQQQLQQQQQHSFAQAALLPSPSPLLDSPFELVDSEKNFRMYPSYCSFPNYFNNHFSTFSSPFLWNYPALALVSVPDNLNAPLPNQPLGLNLNFQTFRNFDSSFCNINHYKPQSGPAQTASSYSYHLPTSFSNIDIMPSLSNNLNQASHAAFDAATLTLHPVLDDEEMAEIHTIGERHDFEWNTTMILVNSAWNKFLKSMEDSPDEEREVHGDEFPVFDEIYDMPSWLSDEDGVGWEAKEGSLFQQNLDKGSYVEDYYQHDAALPCLDIEEIEGWEWLS